MKELIYFVGLGFLSVGIGLLYNEIEMGLIAVGAGCIAYNYLS